MRSFLFVFTVMVFVGCSSLEKTDPYLWLEDITSAPSLEWVKNKNQKTQDHFAKDPILKQLESEALQIMGNRDRIPRVGFIGNDVINFWTDEKNPRGLLRTTSFSDYQNQVPKWKVILNVDELNQKEKKSFVYKGCDVYKPKHPTCLLFLSEGGKDARELREFDYRKGQFIKNGFQIPSQKMSVAWYDENTLLVASDFGPGSLSKSGYPLWVKLWKRGTPLETSPIIFKGLPTDMRAYPYSSCDSSRCHSSIHRAVDFYQTEMNVFKAPDQITRVDLPLVYWPEGVFKDDLYLSLRQDLAFENKVFKKGSLLKAPLGQWKNLSVVYEPHETSSFQSLNFSKDDIYLTVLENVVPKIYKNGKALPQKELGDFSVAATDAFSNRVFVNFESPLTPPSLMSLNGLTLKTLKSLPPQFESSGLKVEQLFATSRDGTKIPYFIVRSKFSRGPGPTLMTAYGGFQSPLLPRYDSLVGKLWLSRGGQYVIANIRGGGEFGPRWHEAALKEKRQNAFDDLYAVAEDLFTKALTTPSRLAFVGGSNGGLLAGVAFTQKPELFKAIVNYVPLLDMLRYHKLLAGHSWIAEYGNPDLPDERKYLMRYSPYQNLKQNTKSPALFLITSTQDDRVHPGHARKFAAKLDQLKIPHYYFENTEGGHGAGADLKQRAHFISLQYAFLLQEIR